jgi:general stress protein YciG
VRGIWRRGSFIEDPESYMEEGSGDEHHLSLSLMEIYKGYLEGGSFAGDFERYAKKGSGTGRLLP